MTRLHGNRTLLQYSDDSGGTLICTLANGEVYYYRIIDKTWKYSSSAPIHPESDQAPEELIHFEDVKIVPQTVVSQMGTAFTNADILSLLDIYESN